MRRLEYAAMLEGVENRYSFVEESPVTESEHRKEGVPEKHWNLHQPKTFITISGTLQTLQAC